MQTALNLPEHFGVFFENFPNNHLVRKHSPAYSENKAGNEKKEEKEEEEETAITSRL